MVIRKYVSIHSEDRDEFKKHLCWKSKLPQEKSNLTLNEILSNKGTQLFYDLMTINQNDFFKFLKYRKLQIS